LEATFFNQHNTTEQQDLGGALLYRKDHSVVHAPDTDRVRANTWSNVNERLDAEAAFRVYEAAGSGAGLDHAIARLDREWDFDRVLETEASMMGMLGLGLGLIVHPRFLLLPGFVAAMVLLHATQGWYPLLPVFRRMGVRSQDEIEREKYALKALRGDFHNLGDAPPSDQAQAARARSVWQAVCL
jgi:hypothetical protein